MKIKQHYDIDDDILSFHWGEDGTDVSEEVITRRGNYFVIDYDKKGRIVGIEIFDWSKKRK